MLTMEIIIGHISGLQQSWWIIQWVELVDATQGCLSQKETKRYKETSKNLHSPWILDIYMRFSWYFDAKVPADRKNPLRSPSPRAVTRGGHRSHHLGLSLRGPASRRLRRSARREDFTGCWTISLGYHWQRTHQHSMFFFSNVFLDRYPRFTMNE